MASVIHAAGHGLSVNDPFKFANVLPDDCGIDETVTYYVLTVPDADSFTFSESEGGTAFTLTSAITEGDILGLDEYEAVDDGNMSPPEPPQPPAAPTLGSTTVSGIVRLTITLAVAEEAPIRAYEVQVTHKFIDADPDWDKASVHTLPEGSLDLTIPALGGTLYASRLRTQDVYGNFSDWSSTVTTTTAAGSDSLNAALADLANDVPDGIITATKISDNAIETRHISANSVTADALAATIVLASLIKTAESGRRIEIDVDGIRLYDTDESLLVRIPTNGDPVYVKGEVNADSLISQTAAEFRTAASLAGNAVMTLQNGVSEPEIAPTLTASVDSLSLTSTPAGVTTAAGIGYDSGAGTFWLAADPSSGYVAHEYNATTGAKVRSIEATGSTTTTTTTLGSTSHITDSAAGFEGSTNSHIAVPLTMPRDGRITKVAAYFAGRNGSCSARVGIWDDVSGTGNALRESATFTASSGGATTVGASDLYNKSLSSELSVSSGQTIYAGFRHLDAAEGFQFDRDDGSGKTTYSGDGTGADGTGWGTLYTSNKPNVYITYEYDTDTRLENAPMIGVATDGTYVYTLDNTGVVWKYDRSTLAYVSKSAVLTAITGTKSKAGLFYDATAAQLVVTTTVGTGAGTYPKFVQVDPSTLTSGTTYSASAGTTFSGSTDTFRGGARVNDALNSNTATYWVATTSAVYAYTFSGSTATQTSNRHFGQSTTVGDGLTHDGTQFRGYDSASPTKVWKFSSWDFTTTSTTLWVGYSWYDSAGTTHETAMGPRSSLTIRRRERVQVQTPAIPTGGADDPDKVRIYALQNATDTGAGAHWLQVTDALTSRYLTSYTGSGTHDGAGTPFAAGTPAELTDAAGLWSLKGDGSAEFDDVTINGDITAANQTYGGSSTDLTVSGGGTATFSSRSLTWFRMGRIVAARMALTVSGNGSGTSTVTILSATAPPPSATSRVVIDRGGTGVNLISLRIANSGGQLQIAQMHNLIGTVAVIEGEDLASGAGYNGMFFYITDA